MKNKKPTVKELNKKIEAFVARIEVYGHEASKRNNEFRELKAAYNDVYQGNIVNAKALVKEAFHHDLAKQQLTAMAEAHVESDLMNLDQLDKLRNTIFRYELFTISVIVLTLLHVLLVAVHRG